MDKYEFNLKVDQIRKMVNRGDYATAKKIADNIDWSRVPNANLLSMVSQVYEKNKDYGNAKAILLMAFERAPIGKRLLYKLTELALKEGSTQEAEDYYREFCDLAGDDPRQYLLRYMVLKEKKAPVEQQIHSLESYTAEELDEKWLYELALLYHESGDAAHCISTCDRITLMFGLGKYVDKAIELKLQHAPLSKYQMDLVDNREKYEEKLRRVELSFDEENDEEEEYVQEPTQEPAQELTQEPIQEPVRAPVRLKAPAAPEPESFEKLPTAEEKKRPPLEVVRQTSYADDDLVAEVQQAEAEEHLARELSRIDPEPYEDDEMGKTRVIGDIRRAGGELRQQSPVQPAFRKPVQEDAAPAYQEADAPQGQTSRANRRAIHLMIEARTPEKGIDIAVEALRQVRQFTGIKNPVAKITGSGLNRRGVLASAEKLAGKDLMVEEAGDLDPGTIGELERLMSRDNTGMRVVLIDNPKQIEMLERRHSSLAEWFEFIREEDVVEVPVEVYPEEAYSEETYPEPAYPEESAPYDPYAMAENPAAQTAAPDYNGYGTLERDEPMETSMYEGYHVPEESMPQTTSSLYTGYDAPEDELANESVYGMDQIEEEPQEIDDRPVRRVVPVRDQAMRAPDGEDIYVDPERSEDEMDIDEFAQYACQYASDIDCSITGKSMLALYERIEIMEEDGLRLTRENAEALIEEAADRAEKPSLGKAIKGIFTSKYNKDGLLILKEEHFI